MKFEDFFRTCTGVAPYDFQRAFATGDALPDLLEAPTGSGKTATAVLGWLWRRLYGSAEQQRECGRRLVFCLPMRTLVEQTMHSVQVWRQRLGLDESELGIHLLMGGAVDERWEAFPDRNAILIGTQDQLLSRALMRGYGMSRFLWPMHFAMLNNDCTWIMDEVQLMGVGASTASQLQAFRETASVFGTVKTVWMTATLAEGRLRTVDARRPFVRMPFETNEPALLARLRATKRLAKAESISGKKGTAEALAGEIASQHEPDSLTIVIVNRVARAQELRRLLITALGVDAVRLVHSRFRPADRKRIQDEVLTGSFKGVLVATQAIEAGVDISAKVLFTELAPWASLVQRFGRLNRGGEHPDARGYWIDLDTDDDQACLPYEAEDLRRARERLNGLADVSPASLDKIPRDAEQPTLPIIRRKDLVELFDTEPDLAGQDIDVSRYVRATEDRDVQVAWRALGNAGPGDDAADLRREELCSVPAHELERLAKGKPIWRFDSLLRRWVKVDKPHPGSAVVIDVSVGGYDDDLGFTRDKSDVPTPLSSDGAAPDADDADDLTYGAAEYVTLALHAADTAEEMEAMLVRLGSMLQRSEAEQRELVDIARWHDAGKAHAAFQEMIVSLLDPMDPRREGGPWAKSDRTGGRNPRRFFRHELASALAWLHDRGSPLGTYLIAAHHGKVRLSLRSRPGEEPPPHAPSLRFAHGVHDGDPLPAVDLGDGEMVSAQNLSLACMDLGGGGEGPAWADLTQQLLEEHGPFKLAYLEMLVRVADWRASAKRNGRKARP